MKKKTASTLKLIVKWNIFIFFLYFGDINQNTMLLDKWSF